MYDEKNISGSFVMVIIVKNFRGFIGESLVMYVRMFFGSSGIKKSKNMVIFFFGELISE